MAINWTDITNCESLDFADVRLAIAEGIEQLVPAGVRVYPHWVYQVDPNSMLGKVTAALRATTGDEAGKVHCWTIGISSAGFLVGESGMPEYTSKHQWRWRLTVDVWGLFEDDGKAEAQRAAENEARLVAAHLWRNSENMVAGLPALTAVYPLNFSSLQPSPFSDGTSVIVAAGSMLVEVAEALSV